MTPVSEPSVLLSLLGGGFVAAFLHAALPTHWLPFTLVGRAQGWGASRVLLAVTAAGLALDQWVEGLLPHLAAVLLFLFGAFYLARATLRRPATAGGPALDVAEPAVSNKAAFFGLVAMMAVSPGEVLLPIYLSSASEGFAALALLTLVFAVGTIAGMAVFTALASAGASILRLERWARYEGAVLGVALIALGLLVALHQH